MKPARLHLLLGLIVVFCLVLWVALTSGAVFMAARLRGLAPPAELYRVARIFLMYGLLNLFLVAVAGVLLARRWAVQAFGTAGVRDAGGDSDRLISEDAARIENNIRALVDRFSREALEEKDIALESERAAEELKRLYGELARAERLAITGRLASGLAHEVGNPIGIIIGFAELLPREGKTRDYREKILSEANRIKDLIAQLLDFARPAAPRMVKTDLRKLVSDTRDLVQGQKAFRGITWDVSLSGPRSSVLADSQRLKQVLMNVFFNAADAMPHGGALRIALSEEGESRVLKVTDTGTGIPESNLDAIFQPFYTTKPGAQGTGLGLAICRRLMEQMQGAIWATSELRKGSTFHLRLMKA
ncbi:MAG: hypothetical protein HYT87_02915 [Nitrospirae bacterium]|nr:hypothetical protein [Nitrospirota bacterium]